MTTIIKAHTGKTRFTMPCPACGSQLVTRVSVKESDLSRKSYPQCPNPACGCDFIARIELVATLRPPLIGNFSNLPPAANDAAKHELANDLIKSESEQSGQLDLLVG